MPDPHRTAKRRNRKDEFPKEEKREKLKKNIAQKEERNSPEGIDGKYPRAKISGLFAKTSGGIKPQVHNCPIRREFYKHRNRLEMRSRRRTSRSKSPPTFPPSRRAGVPHIDRSKIWLSAISTGQKVAGAIPVARPGHPSRN